MPSRAEIRVRVEHLLRGVVIVVLVVMLWQSLLQQTDSSGDTLSARGINGALAKWSALPKAPSTIHVQLDSVPSPTERAWLGALAGAGSSVAWNGSLAPTMIDARTVASPTGGTQVLIAAPSGSRVAVSDDIGPIDTVSAQTTGAMLALNSMPDRITARVKNSVASAVPRDSAVLRKILVIADASWESKFVVAALEEEGWNVQALLRVAPGIDVTQGSPAAIDTSRYSAVVALDGAASPYANRIMEFVRTGGGVVLAPQAASLEAMAPIRAGAPGRAVSDSRAGQAISLATLPFAPITSLRSDAIPLERRAGAIATAARRISAGRALQAGYEDTWRWRMGGGDGAVRDHRMWWTRIVSSVAYAPRVPRPHATASTDVAPVIGLVAAIGPATSTNGMLNLPGNPSDWMTLLLALLVIGLVSEVASRRLRGAS